MKYSDFVLDLKVYAFDPELGIVQPYLPYAIDESTWEQSFVIQVLYDFLKNTKQSISFANVIHAGLPYS